MWGNALQPGLPSAHMHGRYGVDMLKIREMFSDGARPSLAHRPRPLSRDPLDARLPGIRLLERLVGKSSSQVSLKCTDVPIQ